MGQVNVERLKDSSEHGLSEQVMTPGLLRAYFLIVLLLLLNRLTSCWTSTKPLSRKELTWPMKMREQMLLPVMILAVVYSLLWLPVLVVRTVELDNDLSSSMLRVKCVTETCSRVFEMVCASAVLWAILLRPACALYLYFTHWKVWSCLLDVPTHCFLIVIVIIVPREIERYTDEEDREYQAVGDCSDDDDVRPIWQTNHNFNEKGVYNDDVDPWWETKEISGQLPAGIATNFTHPVMTSEDVKLVAEYNERCLLVTVEAPTRTLWGREEDGN